MIRYLYNRQVDPPAPFVHVILRCPESAKTIENLPALVDSGADQTVIPGGLVEALALVPLETVQVAGLGSQILAVPSYKVDVSIRTLSSRTVLVIAHGDEPFILLGRDVLNGYRTVLDGPGLALEIG